VAEIGRERVNNGLNNDPKFPSNENKGTPFKNFSHSLVLSQQTNSSQSSSYIPERFQMDTRIVLPKRKVPTTVRPKIVDLPPLSDITKAQNESEDTRDIPMFLVDALKSNSRTAVDSKSVSRCKKDDEANEDRANEDLDTSVDNSRANTTSGSLNESALNAFLSNNPANDSSMFLSDSFLSPANKSPAVGNPFKVCSLEGKVYNNKQPHNLFSEQKQQLQKV
jgi:hypothetical protein